MWPIEKYLRHVRGVEAANIKDFQVMIVVLDTLFYLFSSVRFWDIKDETQRRVGWRCYVSCNLIALLAN